ncbi:MAG: metal-sensitive transcriptional regulator [Actinomycetota bacterium]|nr:metal-sensitive transcriptional regulator [Actinomycetota bacterium]
MSNSTEIAAPQPIGIQLTDDEAKDLLRRLARVEGQVRGLAKMIEERRECDDVVTQFQATLKALERVGFRMVAAQLFACAKRDDVQSLEEFERLQSLFLKLK